jgi:type I restriction enzyme R subunit
MPTSDISEKGLESLIVTALTGYTEEAAPSVGVARELASGPYSGAGYVQGSPADYDRDHAVDLAKLLSFLKATQSTVVAQLGLDADGPKRQQFLARL